MKLAKGHLYHIRFYDHNEATKKVNPNVILNVVGKYVGMKSPYLIFSNWWADRGSDGDVVSRANVLKKAVIEVRRLFGAEQK